MRSTIRAIPDFTKSWRCPKQAFRRLGLAPTEETLSRLTSEDDVIGFLARLNLRSSHNSKSCSPDEVYSKQASPVVYHRLESLTTLHAQKTAGEHEATEGGGNVPKHHLVAGARLVHGVPGGGKDLLREFRYTRTTVASVGIEIANLATGIEGRCADRIGHLLDRSWAS